MVGGKELRLSVAELALVGGNALVEVDIVGAGWKSAKLECDSSFFMLKIEVTDCWDGNSRIDSLSVWALCVSR